MNIKNIQIVAFLFVFTLLLGGSTVSVHAQEAEQIAQYRDGDRGWWWGSRDEINDLDDDIVENIPIPILFGVELGDIYPNFGDDRDGGSRQHEGLDILAPEGTPVISPTEAVVTRVGEGSSSGIYVRTANPGGEQFVYMHLVDTADIESGDELEVGELIGYVGNTGNAEGGVHHLHFEIREGREAKDPYDRITEEFSLEEKIEYTEDTLRDADDPSELAAFLASEFSSVFSQARLADIETPEEIEDELPDNNSNLVPPARDLSVGSEGDDVSVLQNRLIAGGYLEISTPTGYFGPLTESALAAYQQDNDIQPASGYYGPITRRRMVGSVVSTYDTEDMSRSEMIDLIATLTALVEQLQAELSQ